VADFLRFVVVAFYLAGVLAWLVASRQIRPAFSFRRTIRSFFARRRAPRPLIAITPDSGHCYRAAVDPELLSDAERLSYVQVFEDGVPLPRPRADHDTIRLHGKGAYSHWNAVLYFSTTDNSDPRSNGRRYVYKEVQP